MAHFAKDVDNFSAARTVKIVGSENIENYTLYLIELTVGPYSWTVRHRYSDFHDLHEKLVSSCKLERNLLPPKKLFGNQSEAFIKRRLGDLETYLQTIMYFLVNRLPPPLAAFLDFNKYEIHGVTHALAEELYNKGDLILQAKDTFQMSPLQLYSLTERLKLPEPTCDSGDLKKDIGHILDFITRLKYLKIVGTRDPVGTSNIDMNQLKFDLTLFKSLQSLEILYEVGSKRHLVYCQKHNVNIPLEECDRLIKLVCHKCFHYCTSEIVHLHELFANLNRYLIGYDDEGSLSFKTFQLGHEIKMLNCNVLMIQGLETVKQTLCRCEVHHSVRAVRDILLQELPHWRAEDGAMLISPWEKLIAADFSHNNIIEIDDSVQLLQHVEFLDLSHNVIEAINHIQWLSQLRHLNLSHNSIRQLDALHTKLGNLKTLNLSGNKLESLHGFSKLFSLEVLNVSNNDISQIGEVRFINNLPCLESVLLLGNPVTIVPDYRNKVLEIFGDRASEVSLDNRRATQKELDTVAVLQAIQKARDGKDRHKLTGARKAVVTEVPVVEPGPSPQMSSSHDSTTAVIGWSVTDAQNFSSDPDIFRLQIEAVREQGGEAWLSLLNELQTSNSHRHQVRELLSALSSPGSSDGQTVSPIDNPPSLPPEDSGSTSCSPGYVLRGSSSADTSTAEPNKRAKSLSSADKGFTRRFIDQEKLPGTDDAEFVTTLQSQLLSVELMFDDGREDVEGIRQILWCYAIQFSRPLDKQVACVALTDRHVFVQRLKGMTGKINASGASTTSETETFYIMPLFNIQKVVLGREWTCVRLEEAFVGANGTFTLIGLDPEGVKRFVTTLQSLYQGAIRSGDGLEQPDLLDLSDSDLLKTAISNTEKTPDPKDVDIIFSSMVFVNSQPSCLVLTDHTFYVFSDNCVRYPPPTFEVTESTSEQYELVHRFPVMTKIGTMELFNSSGKGLLDKTCYTSVAKKTDSVQYEHYGISLSLDLDDGCLQTVEIIFLTSRSRDEFLEKLTQLRFDNAQKMSPTHRGEPEGGNETSETDSSEEPRDNQEGSSVKIVLHHAQPEPAAVVAQEDHGSTVERKPSRSFTTLELGYPGARLVSHLTGCVSRYSLVCPIPAKLHFLVDMTGRELVTYFHSNIAEIGFDQEELRHVAWAHVVPYHNPRQEILSLLLLTTRGVYMLSDDHIREPRTRPSWMTHTRHKSDSVISRHLHQRDHHHTSGILHTGSELSNIPKPFKILHLCDIKLVNVGLFDQYFRLTGHSEENVFTVLTRDCYKTEEFIKQLTQVLSLVSGSPTPDVADEPDFYRAFSQRTKSTIEGLEYTLPSKVKFCYPGEESLSDMTYLINDTLGESQQQTQATHVWIYLLGYVYMGHFSGDVQSQAQPRGIILSNKHICLIIEDLVSYPLPEFVRGLPERPRQEVVEGRKVEYLKEVTIYKGHRLSLLFSDESEEITVDTSFEHYGVDRAVKGRESPPQIIWTLFIQSIREKEKFVQLLARQWSETHDGITLPINTLT